jgi:DNA-binding HxlR family transcriptional regulator
MQRLTKHGLKSYGQFCPVAKAAEVFCERWTPLIVRDLTLGACRFSELKRGVPLASPTLLSLRLKQLEREGIISRRKGDGRRDWRYELTPAGKEFAPLVTALGTWANDGRAGRWKITKSTLGCCCTRWNGSRSPRRLVASARLCS